MSDPDPLSPAQRRRLAEQIRQALATLAAQRAVQHVARSAADPLMVDFDDTDRRLRLWRDAVLVGELRPSTDCTPAGELRELCWTGWIASSAVVELFGTYVGCTEP